MNKDVIATEVETKLEKLRAYMDARDLEGVHIRLRDNFAWLSGGHDNHVVNASERGFSSLLVTQESKYLVTDNIEVGRLLDEELVNLGWEPATFEWFEPDGLVSKVRAIVPGNLMSDVPFPNAVAIDLDFDHLRYVLLPSEIERLRILGRDVSGVLADTCRKLEPGMTEHEIASLLGAKAIAKGIEPSARLVGVDGRTRRYRHPIPTDEKLEKHALVVLLGQRGGLYINCTRLVHFGRLPDDLKRNFDVMCQVDAAYIISSKVGVNYRDILEKGAAIYETNGYKDEWKNFTQGGVIGYRSREFVVTPDTKEMVMDHQAIAWNPTISGVKGEDTILVSDGRVEVLSEMPGWPMVEVSYEGEFIRRPDILLR